MNLTLLVKKACFLSCLLLVLPTVKDQPVPPFESGTVPPSSNPFVPESLGTLASKAITLDLLSPEISKSFMLLSRESSAPIWQSTGSAAIKNATDPTLVVKAGPFHYPTVAEKKQKVLQSLKSLNPRTPYQNWQEVPLWHKVLLIIMAFFTVLTVVMLLAVVSSRFYKLRVQARTEKLKKRYELLLMHVLFFDEDTSRADWDQDRIVQHFKKHYLKSAFKRKILIIEILDLNKNFTGQFAENLRLLFIYLSLEKDSFKLLKSSQWNLKAQGICELAQMLVYEAAPYIKKLINHPNDLVRMESHIALVKLDKRRGLAFLPHLHRSFTQWQQLNLQHALSKFDREDIPDFSEYLASGNVEVVAFSLKMIGIYNQVDALPAVEQLLQHPLETIRLTTIETIQQLDAAHAVPALIAYFPAAPQVQQVAILRAVASLGGAPVEFFTEQLLSGDHAVKVVAARALHDAQQLEEFQRMQAKVMDAQLQQIIRHALDHRN